MRNADQIIVLDQGRIAEHGTHDELLALGGRYAALAHASPPHVIPPNALANTAGA